MVPEPPHRRADDRPPLHIAFFVSPHGFGHATRSAAVMAAVQDRRPETVFEVFTSAPEWIFGETLRGSYRCHHTESDVGLVQTTPLREDLDETLATLRRFYPLREDRIARLAAQLQSTRCALVVCDIAPLGIAVARRAHLPAVLLENFTWDWIYAAYADEHPELRSVITYLRELFASADHHIQTEPVCRPADADLVTRPVSRPPRTGRTDQRRALGIGPQEIVVLISMGGLSTSDPALSRLGQLDRVRFVVPSHVDEVRQADNGLWVPWSGACFHPDLIAASDAVVSKLGYSTLAEVFHAGAPFGFVTRERFPETRPLQAFVERRMQGCSIAPAAFEDGSWIEVVPSLLALPRTPHEGPTGAAQAAEFLIRMIDARR